MKPITFQTKIYELLEDYPQLEDLLVEISPAFAKLKNPVLRRTIARVTTIQQAAAIAGIEAGEVVSRLRKAAGISDVVGASGELSGEDDNSEKYGGGQPDWFSPDKITVRYDAVKTLEAGDVPMAEILKLSNSLQNGEIFEFTSPFMPTPVLDMLVSKGFKVWSIREGNVCFNRIIKSS